MPMNSNDDAAAFIHALMAASTDFVLPQSTGPVLKMYKIDFHHLPVTDKIKQLMRAIMQSVAPYDNSFPRTRIGDDTVGAMRQIHANAPPYLPSLQDSMPHSGRARLYDAYAQANKHHSAGRGGGAVSTGYVEYTAGDLDDYRWGGNRFRIVFDYIHSRLYFAPLHYASWEFSGSRLTVVDKPAPHSGYPNPFFWITDIK
jgi:hypothetical protein